MTLAANMPLAHDALLPRAPGGNGPGAALALLVHAGLVAALTVSVDWRTQSSDVVAAELWAAVPQAAAPIPAVVAPVAQPPAPPPTVAPAPPPAAARPIEADIATERAERKKADAERKKAEAAAEAEANRKKRELADADRKKRDLADREAREAREAKAEDERLARQREENLRRMMGQAGTVTAGTGTAAQAAAPSAAYTGRLVALIRGNLVFTGSLSDNNAAEVEVSAAPGGAIISRRLVKSSGHKDWDDAVLRAIDKTATLPRDTDGRVPPRLLIAFRPKD